MTSGTPALFVSTARDSQARKDMIMENNQDTQTGTQTSTQEKTRQIPMIVTDETIRDFGIDPSTVRWRLVDNRRCRVVMIDVTEDFYKADMASQSAENKRQDREGRCMVEGKNGRPIRCPDSNRCSECERYAEMTRAENRPILLSALMDSGIEPSVDSFEDDVLTEIAKDDFVAKLNAIKPMLGQIFSLHCDGVTQQQIADELGMKQRTVSDHIQKAKRLTQSWMEED